MSRRGDRIRKRKDGRWEGRYNKGRDNEGRIKYGSVYGKTYSEAKEKLESISAITTDAKRELKNTTPLVVVKDTFIWYSIFRLHPVFFNHLAMRFYSLLNFYEFPPSRGEFLFLWVRR